MSMFDIDTKDLKRLAKLFAKSPQIFRQTSAEFLTVQAFEARGFAQQEIRGSMISRNRGLLKAMLKYKGARGSQSLSRQESTAFSLDDKGFSGWVEQQFSQRSDAKRVPTTKSRVSQSKRRTVAGKHRLRKGTEVRHVGSYRYSRNTKSLRSKESSMLRQMTNRNYKGLFHITGRGIRGYKQGVYKLDYTKSKPRKGSYKYEKEAPRALIMVQRTGLQGTSPKTNRWLSRARKRALKEGNTREWWNRAYERTMHKRMKRALKSR